ncbi:MAG: hypothetical protein JXA60_04575 [Candidatus Coatesbacteria bacterium]|nr:hypothetical protein [Candidatus Coatesbacteria bacterium]
MNCLLVLLLSSFLINETEWSPLIDISQGWFENSLPTAISANSDTVWTFFQEMYNVQSSGDVFGITYTVEDVLGQKQNISRKEDRYNGHAIGCIDDLNRIWVVWNENYNYMTSIHGKYRDGGNWSSDIKISGDNIKCWWPYAQIDSTKRLNIIYCNDFSSTIQNIVLVTYKSTEGFSNPLFISNESYYDHDPSLTPGNNGKVMIAWERHFDSDNCKILYSIGEKEAFSIPDTIAEAPSGIKDCEVDISYYKGRYHAFWTRMNNAGEQYLLWSNLDPQTAKWTNPQRIDDGYKEQRAKSLNSSYSGRLYVAYTIIENDRAYRRIAVKYYDGEQWSNREFLTEEDKTCDHVYLTNWGNSIWAVFCHLENNNSRIYARYLKQNASFNKKRIIKAEKSPCTILFENPVRRNSHINLESVNDGRMIIIDLNGKVKESIYLAKGKSRIRCNLSSGVYYFVFESSGSAIKTVKKAVVIE